MSPPLVQYAYKQGTSEVPRPWSKYSEGASAHAKVKAAEAAEKAELEPVKVSVREEKKKRKLKHVGAEGAEILWRLDSWEMKCS